MPITTVPAKTSISRRTIQLKPITGSRRMATISLHHSRTIPTRTHRSSPCRDMPRVRRATTSPAVRTAMVSHMVSRLPTVRPSPHMARPLPLTGSRLSLRNLHSPSTASRRTDLRITHNRRRPPIIRSRLSPNTRSPHTNQPPTYAQQTYYQATQQQPGYGYAQKSKIVAGLLGLFLGTLGVHNFYLGYTGKAVAQLLLTLIGWIILIGPIISGIWALIEAVLILCSSYGSNWHRDGRGQELQD